VHAQNNCTGRLQLHFAHFYTFSTVSTAGVSGTGAGRVSTALTEQTPSQNQISETGESPESAARGVGTLLTLETLMLKQQELFFRISTFYERYGRLFRVLRASFSYHQLPNILMHDLHVMFSIDRLQLHINGQWK
jgi:hypothetical protein